MKIGFMGGTFSPPHLGHLHSAKVFIDEMSLDKLYIIPASVSPFKTEDAPTASDMDRFNMAKLCFDGLSTDKCTVIVSSMELDRSTISYTVNTIRDLKEKHQNDELYMFVGSDMFMSLERWREFETIFKYVTIYTRCRKKNETKAMLNTANRYEDLYGASIYFSRDKEVIVSSTLVREALDKRNFALCQRLLPQKVLCYIKERELYF